MTSAAVENAPQGAGLSVLFGPRHPVPQGQGTLFEAIARHCARQPEAIALCHGDQIISYGQLGHGAARIAAAVQAAGLRPGTLVPVVTAGGPGMIAAMIGLWAAGAAFAPIAADAPARRRDMALSVIAEAGPAPGDLAYGFFTSGSTGGPKCCLNIHSGLANRAAAMTRRFGLAPGEAVLQNSSPVFDNSLWQIFWPLSVGARVVIPRWQGILDLEATLAQIAAHSVRMTDFVPSILERLVQRKRCIRPGIDMDFAPKLAFGSSEAC